MQIEIEKKFAEVDRHLKFKVTRGIKSINGSPKAMKSSGFRRLPRTFLQRSEILSATMKLY
jgi:hypothetical protein